MCFSKTFKTVCPNTHTYYVPGSLLVFPLLDALHFRHPPTTHNPAPLNTLSPKNTTHAAQKKKHSQFICPLPLLTSFQQPIQSFHFIGALFRLAFQPKAQLRRVFVSLFGMPPPGAVFLFGFVVFYFQRPHSMFDLF